MSYQIPSDAHHAGDTGEVGDLNNDADVLGLLASVLARISTGTDVGDPGGNAANLSTLLAVKAGTAPAQNYAGVFGDGSDGAVVFDGSTTVLGIAPSSNTYTLARDIFCTNITINNGVTVQTGSYRIFARGTVTNNGTIDCSGKNGGATGGASGGTQGGNGSFRSGQSSGAGNTGAGSAGNAANTSYGVGNAGAGGNGTGANTGGAAGTTGAQSSNTWMLRANPGVLILPNNNGGNTPLSGASGGGGGGGDGTNKGGGGGGGGGYIMLLAWAVVNNGVIQAPGGNGGTPTTGNCGGGGAGAGGAIVIYSTIAATGTGTTNVSPGTAGNGVGTGTAGGTATAGTYMNVILN